VVEQPSSIVVARSRPNGVPIMARRKQLTRPGVNVGPYLLVRQARKRKRYRKSFRNSLSVLKTFGAQDIRSSVYGAGTRRRKSGGDVKYYQKTAIELLACRSTVRWFLQKRNGRCLTLFVVRREPKVTPFSVPVCSSA